MSYYQSPPDPQQPYDPNQPQVPAVPSAPPVSPAGYGPPQSPGPYPPQPMYQQQQQPGYPPQPMYPQVVVARALPPSGWAIASLIFGILGMLGGFCLFAIPCIVAVICGHVGLNETKDGSRSGRGMAIAGLILGYFFVIPAIIVIVTGGLGSLLPSSTSP